MRVLQKEDNYKLPKEIKLAKFAGFCYGVKRAVETVKKLKAEKLKRAVQTDDCKGSDDMLCGRGKYKFRRQLTIILSFSYRSNSLWYKY